jgi:hypothetical protein
MRPDIDPVADFAAAVDWSDSGQSAAFTVMKITLVVFALRLSRPNCLFAINLAGQSADSVRL